MGVNDARKVLGMNPKEEDDLISRDFTQLNQDQ